MKASTTCVLCGAAFNGTLEKCLECGSTSLVHCWPGGGCLDLEDKKPETIQ